MKPNTTLASGTAGVLKPVRLSASWFTVFECWELVPCWHWAALSLRTSIPAEGGGCVLYSKASGGRDGARDAQGKTPVVPTCPQCGAAGGCREPDPPLHEPQSDCRTCKPHQAGSSPASRCARVHGATPARIWVQASCLRRPPGSPAGWSRCCHSSSAAGTQGSLIKLGCVATCCNHSLNDCKFGLVDLLNPCIFSVPVCCKSQTFSVFFIWFQKTVSVLKTSLWKMLVYPAVLFYLGWLHN